MSEHRTYDPKNIVVTFTPPGGDLDRVRLSHNYFPAKGTPRVATVLARREQEDEFGCRTLPNIKFTARLQGVIHGPLSTEFYDRIITYLLSRWDKRDRRRARMRRKKRRGWA